VCLPSEDKLSAGMIYEALPAVSEVPFAEKKISLWVE
jgi:hypothetical protein